MPPSPTLSVFAGGVFVLFAGGVLCVAAGRRAGVNRLGGLIGAAGCAISGAAGAWALLANQSFDATLSWPGMALGAIHVGLDPLSGFFALVVALLGFLGSIYGMGYWAAHKGRRALGFGWAEYHFLVGAMLLVVMARDGVLFLVAWEVMSVASFLLVIFERGHREALEAGWVYLAATHLGAACLIVMFLLLGRGSDSFDFALIGKDIGPAAAGTVFILAILGFGSKAGFVPMHVWLPEAHPAAPSHVSALMSGAMIKMGIYGIVRTILMLGTPPAWWGWTLLGIGAVSGILGVLYALAQHNLKRLLAYHSVENIGIILLGLGLGVIGWSTHHLGLAALGFAGGFLHVFNHAVFKGLLFLSAGSVLHSTHTADMDHLGGLMRRMPYTGAFFVVGAAAICGLPPLNGFVSEFLIYLGSFREVASETAPMSLRLACILALTSLAMIGGLAGACFVKAAGTVFLGEPRSSRARTAREAGFSMLFLMGVLSLLCVAVGLSGPVALRIGWNVLGAFPFTGSLTRSVFDSAAIPLRWVSLGGGALLLIVAAAVAVRKILQAGKPRGRVGTWDCGYVAPSTRMQYTSSSFAAPLVELFRPVLGTRTQAQPPKGLFPRQASLRTHTGDLCRSLIFRPLFQLVQEAAQRLRPLQHGRIQIYVLYLAAVLLILLVWKLR